MSRGGGGGEVVGQGEQRRGLFLIGGRGRGRVSVSNGREGQKTIDIKQALTCSGNIGARTNSAAVVFWRFV